MQTITSQTLANTLYYNGIAAFTYKINYPSFTTTCNTYAAKSINAHYENLAENTELYCQKVLFAQAVNDIRYIQDDRPFHSYTLDAVYHVTYNAGCLTSLYLDTYTYMGGAHGETKRTSDTWDFHTGKRLLLTDVYPLTPASLYHLKRSTEQQIEDRLKENPSSYFDDYKSLLQNTFNKDHFYLQPDRIVIYFQQYDLAPYSTGIPEFYLPVRYS